MFGMRLPPFAAKWGLAAKTVLAGTISGILVAKGAAAERDNKNTSDNKLIEDEPHSVSEYSCKDCSVLRSSLNAAGRAHYDLLTKMPSNKGHCESMAYGVMQNILTNNIVGIKHQLDTLGSSNNCVLNYKLVKMFQKMEAIGEQEGLNYYRTWIEEDVWGLLPIRKRWTLYHQVNKQWIWPTLAALTTVSPLVFKAFPEGPFSKAVGTTRIV
jgi:hypothetical protein